jgi:hypothetical protein
MRRRPHHTPRTTLGLGFWVFGLYAALFAAAPGAITPQQEAAYEQHMRVVRCKRVDIAPPAHGVRCAASQPCR